jgi:hypothetical protein
VKPEFLARQRALISERSFAVEYEAEFTAPLGRAFDSQDIERCLVAEIPPLLGGAVVVGVDWAQAVDFTAIAVVQGHAEGAHLVETARFNALSWERQVELVSEIAARYPGAIIVCDDTGIGRVVDEMLARSLTRHRLIRRTFTPKFKASIVQGLQVMIERSTLRFRPNAALQRELESFEFVESIRGGVRAGAMAGSTDDLVIALALAVSELPSEAPRTIRLGSMRSSL